MLTLFFIGTILCIFLDQATKYLVLDALSLDFWNLNYNAFCNPIEIIKGIFNFDYVGNRGGAFGILSELPAGRIFLIIFTVIFIGAVVFFMVKKKPQSKLLIVSLTLLTGGALGNFIDRIFRGFVVDFLDFTFINFPLFNVADCFVVAAAFLLAIYILFFSPDFPQKKQR